MKDNSEKLAISEKVGYSLGDCGANFVFQTQIIFLMNFYTDVFGIAATTAGWMFFISRLWDAVNDPLIGALSDRTSTRWGRFRPWVLLTAVPFAVCFVLAYTVPDYSSTGKIIWAYVTYNALMMVYTANNIPYSALTGVITADPVERTSLTSWRFFFAMLAGFFVATFTDKLVEYFGQGDEAAGYQMTIGFWAVIAVVFFVITFSTTQERVQPNPEQKTSIKQDLTDLFKNRNWLILALLTICIFIYLAMRGGIGKYYFDYYVERKDAISLGLLTLTPFGFFNAVSMTGNLVGILFSKPLSMRFGKRDTFKVCLFLTAIITALFTLIPKDAEWTIFGLQFVLQFIYGITIPLLWAMMADVADFTEWKTGRRATGMTFAASVFALKLGLSIGGLLTGKILEFYEYSPNAEQTELALTGIRYTMSIFPSICFFLGVGVLFFYQINRPMESEMHDALVEIRKSYAIN